MDLEFLNSFIILAKNLNYTSTADIVGITQPALSKRIAMLESELGCKLFYRNTREVRLTPEGELLIPFANSLLLKGAELKDVINQNKNVTTVLRIGLVGTSFIDTLPAFVNTFKKRHPSIILEYRDGKLSELIDDYYNGTIDMLLASETAMKKIKKSDKVIVRKDQVYILVNKNSPFASYESLTIDDLKDETFIMLEQHHSHASPFHSSRNDLLSEACLASGISPNIVIASELTNLPLLVSCGAGVAIGTKQLQFFSHENVCFVPYKTVKGDYKYFDCYAFFDGKCSPVAETFASEYRDFYQ